MSQDTLHTVNAPGTRKLQITFRGSRPEDARLWAALVARSRRDGVNYVDVIRAALTAYLDPS